MKEMNNISYGLFVVTTKTDKINGCISNSFMQVTTTPNAVALTLNKANKTTEMIMKSKKFNVSILNTNTTFDIIEKFGFASGHQVDKFENFSDYKLSKNQIPYITKNTNTYLSCEVFSEKDLGTHIMFFANVVDGEILSNTPSLTYAEYHAKVKPKKKTTGGYVCSVCGYVYEGDELPEDFICPICKQGASVFVKQESTQKNQEPAKSKNVYVCPVCGYTEESDTPVEKCIICGAEMQKK